MTDRHELLRRPIKSLDDAKRWVEELSALELSFHFEDDPAEIVIGLSGVGLFSDEEAMHVKRRVSELYDLKWPEEFQCPIGYLLKIEGHLYE